MKSTQKAGPNRTGVQMSPAQSKEMAEGSRNTPPTDPNGHHLADMRNPYRMDADPLGSMPPPASARGVVQAGKGILTGERPQVFLDMLGERLAFERSGTRLYDALIEKFQSTEDLDDDVPMEMLQQFRDEEAQHFKLVVGVIEKMGGDPTTQTPGADNAGVEAAGLMQAINDPRTSAAQCLHAILVAELVDNDGWETLIAVAEQLGETELVESFRVALKEEDRHLEQVRAWYQAAVLRMVNTTE